MRDTFFGTCTAGCGMPPRSLADINQDLSEAPAREWRNAELAAHRAANTTRPQDVEQTARSLLSARLTRFQLELAGYCPTCALRGQLKAIETGLRRTAHA
jgi:hypothetical protein